MFEDEITRVDLDCIGWQTRARHHALRIQLLAFRSFLLPVYALALTVYVFAR